MFFAYVGILIILHSFAIVISNSELDSAYGEVIFAAVVFRHGERTPVGTYPTDPHKNYKWKHGYGQLTDKGKQHLYDLGKWFKKRYGELTGNYSPLKVLVQSSDINRTIESGQCFLTGYYPPTSLDAFFNLSWQPIPIHTIPLEIDDIIMMSKPCIAFSRELHKLGARPEFADFYSKHFGLIKYIETNAEIPFPQFSVLAIVRKFTFLNDVLKVENENGLILPNWTKSIYPEPLTTLAQDLFVKESYNYKVKKLHAGPFLSSLKTDLINRKNNASPLRLHLYSGHDSTIAAIMMALDIYNYKLPPYGASLMFELRNKTDLNLLVLYKNSTEEPYLMKIPKSEGNSLEHFLNAISVLIPKNWNKACNSK